MPTRSASRVLPEPRVFASRRNPGTVTECRKACEAAAGYAAREAGQESPERETRKAFEALALKVFSEETEKAKRETLSGLMMALGHLRNAGGAHAWRFEAQILREDAEVALTVAMAIFRYMGEAVTNRRSTPKE